MCGADLSDLEEEKAEEGENESLSGDGDKSE